MMWLTKKPKTVTDPVDKEAGVTLFELLVAMVILTLLATLIVPNVIQYVGRSNSQTAQSQMSSIATSLELYYLDMGQYPTDEEGLLALMEAPDEATSWQGPYFQNASGLTDPWGREYDYELNETGRGFTVSTLGLRSEIGGEGEERDLTQS